MSHPINMPITFRHCVLGLALLLGAVAPIWGQAPGIGVQDSSVPIDAAEPVIEELRESDEVLKTNSGDLDAWAWKVRVMNYKEVNSAIRYPEQAQKQGIEGKVTLRLLVDTSGHLVKDSVFGEGDPLLLEAVLEQVPKLEFIPAFEDGGPIQEWTTLEFKFQLEH